MNDVCKQSVETAGFPLGFRPENVRVYDETSTTLCNGTRPGFTCGIVSCVSGGDTLKVYESHGMDARYRDLGEKSQTVSARWGTGGCNTPMVVDEEPNACGVDCYNQAVTGAVSRSLNSAATDSTHIPCVAVPKKKYTVRRITPLEAERLQGYPDKFTDIGDWIDSKGKKRKCTDAARYKALGNSIAIPPWLWVLSRLNQHCGDDKTMASLFDGISGFPLIWSFLNGKENCVWGSEIEEFCIAVSKKYFPDEEQ